MAEFHEELHGSYTDSDKELKAQVIAAGVPWEDPDFPADNSSLYPGGDHDKLLEGVVWKRPSQYLENAHLIRESDFLTKHIVDKSILYQNQELGIYQLHLWHEDHWSVVSVDDRIPTRNNKPIFHQEGVEHTGEFWAELFEKAHAKLHGSYEGSKKAQADEARADSLSPMDEPDKNGYTVSAEPLVIPASLGLHFDTVWDVVYNLNNYHVWNTFVYKVDVGGDIAVGTKILLYLHMGGKNSTSPEMIDSFIPPDHSEPATFAQISWRFDKAWVPHFMLNSSHVQTVHLNPLTKDITVKSWETFKGMLHWMIRLFVSKEIREGFNRQQHDLYNYLKSIAPHAHH